MGINYAGFRSLLAGLLFIAGCGSEVESYAKNCRQLALSIEADHSRYWNDLLFLKSRINAAPKDARKSKAAVRGLNQEMIALVEKRRAFLREALLDSANSPLRCGCGGMRLEELRSIARREIDALTNTIEDVGR